MLEELVCKARPLEKDTALLHRQKAELRAFARVILAQTSHSAFLLQSENMRNILCASPVWHTSRSVLAFAPIISEPDLLPVNFQERDIFCLKRLSLHSEPVAIYSLKD